MMSSTASKPSSSSSSLLMKNSSHHSSRSALRYNPMDMLEEDSSDDEELDELLKTTILTPHKHKRTLIIGKRHSSIRKDKDKSKSAEITMEQIEAQAKRQVPDLDLHLVKDVHSLDDLGWFRQKAKTRDEYYPCRKCPPVEGEGLFDDPELAGHVLVRVLGWNHPSSGTYLQIRERQWEALGRGKGGSDNNDNNNNNNDERKLKVFLNLNDTKNAFVDNPVGLKLEELAVRAQWEKVRKRQESLANGGGSRSVDHEDEGLDPSCLQLRFSAEMDETKAMPMSLDVVRTISKDNLHSNHSTNETDHKKEKERLADADSDDNSSDDDSDDDDDIDQFTSPGAKRKKEKLRDGDVIEYYDPIGIAGHDEWLRRATILGINPKNKHLPLNLDNGQSLDRQCLIKLAERRIRGKLVANEGGKFKRLKAFSLTKCGTEELVALNRFAQHAKQIRKSHQEGVSKFWNKTNNGDDGVEAGEEAHDEEEEATTTECSKAAIPIVSQPEEEEEPEPKTPAWKIHLEELLQSTRQKMEKSKRLKPPMLPEQLEVVLEVWSKLQQRMDRTGQTNQEIVLQLTHEVGLSLLRIDTVMHGDTRSKLSVPNKIEVIEELQKWLDTAATKFIEAPFEEPKLETPLRKKRPLAQPSTNRRKRLKEEMAQSIANPIFNTSSSSLLSLSTPSRQGTGSQVTTPATHRIRRGETSSAVASSRKRRVAQSVDTHRTKTAVRASARSRRPSYTPSVETIRAREIFRETAPVEETPSKRKNVRPAYEPPSVTRRRKRESAGLLSKSSGSADSDDTCPRKKQRRRSTASVASSVSSTSSKKIVVCPIELARAHLRSMIKAIEEKAKVKKRFKVHMTVDQLKLALKFWDQVPAAESKPDEVVAFITKVSLDLGVSHFKLTRFLKGDSDKKLGVSQLNDIQQRLQEWTAELTTATGAATTAATTKTEEVADDKGSRDVVTNNEESEAATRSQQEQSLATTMTEVPDDKGAHNVTNDIVKESEAVTATQQEQSETTITAEVLDDVTNNIIKESEPATGTQQEQSDTTVTAEVPDDKGSHGVTKNTAEERGPTQQQQQPEAKA